VSAVASLLRGRRYIYEEEEESDGAQTASNRHLLKLALVAVWMAREGAAPGASVVDRERLRRALLFLSLLVSLLVKEGREDRALPKPTGTEPVPGAPAE